MATPDKVPLVRKGKHIAVPTEIVNLDLPPSDRWKAIGIKYKEDIQAGMETIMSFVPDFLVDLIDEIGKTLESLLPPPYREELLGLAAATDIHVGELFLLNIAYDITAHCTSIVAQKGETLLHARNLDAPGRDVAEFGEKNKRFMSTARDTCIAVLFKSGGKTVYSGVTFAGVIGLATGHKPNSFTISLNERRTGSVWENLLTLLQERPGSAVTFLIRDALADPDINYQGVLNRMTYIPMIAASYITIAGTKPGEGAVISRDRREAVKPFSRGVLKLPTDTSKEPWYLFQTNHDHWTKPPNIQPAADGSLVTNSHERKAAGKKAMAKMGQSNLSPQHLINILSGELVLNEHTMYTTVMTAAHPSQLNKSWIRNA